MFFCPEAYGPFGFRISAFFRISGIRISEFEYDHHRVFASGVFSCERGWVSHTFTVRSRLADASRGPSCPFLIRLRTGHRDTKLRS